MVVTPATWFDSRWRVCTQAPVAAASAAPLAVWMNECCWLVGSGGHAPPLHRRAAWACIECRMGDTFQFRPHGHAFQFREQADASPMPLHSPHQMAKLTLRCKASTNGAGSGQRAACTKGPAKAALLACAAASTSAVYSAPPHG